jgi:hypothetical protein
MRILSACLLSLALFAGAAHSGVQHSGTQHSATQQAGTRPAPAQSAAGKRPSATAVQLSRAAIAGIKIGAEAALTKGQIKPEVDRCVRALDEAALVAVYDKLLRDRFTPQQIRTLDKFYGSEAGKRYFRWTMNTLRSQNGLPVNDPIELSAKERKRADDFQAKPPARTLNDITGGSDKAVMDMLNREIQTLLAPCR